MNTTLDRAPTLEDFCDVANDLYAAPTEERFLAVVNLARESLILRGLAWDEGFAFGLRRRDAEIARLRHAIQKTLDENGHLADGENCTLILLKRALETSNA